MSQMSCASEISFEKNVANLLIKVAETNGFKNYEIKKLAGTTKGDGYVGIMSRAKIVDNDDKRRVLNLIIKCAPKSDDLRRLLNLTHVFKREAYMYNQILKTFREFEIERGLFAQEFSPLLYSSLMEDKLETLVLQDLKYLNYQLYERRVPMTEDHLRLVLSQYGRLHALSYALKNQNPENWKVLTVSLNDIFLLNMFKTGFIKSLIRQCIKVQKAFDNEDEELTDLEPYKLFIENIQPFLEELISYDDEFSVILHGDCWTNNMMFKYEDNASPSKPTSVKFIDYQLARMGSPVVDLSYFFYSCGSKQAMDNLDDYLQVYYNSLSDYLSHLGSDPTKIFPEAVFLEHWRKYSRFGLLMSMTVIRIMLTEPDEAVDLAEASHCQNDMSKAFDYEIKKSDLYYERVKPIIRHFIERKFI